MVEGLHWANQAYCGSLFVSALALLPSSFGAVEAWLFHHIFNDVPGLFEELHWSNQALWLYMVDLRIVLGQAMWLFVCLSMFGRLFHCIQALGLPHACSLENLMVLMFLVAN